MTTSVLVVRCAARTIGWRVLGLVLAAWAAVCAVAPVSLQMLFPQAELDELTASAAMLGLVLPVSLGSLVLREPLPRLIASAPRPMTGERIVVSTGLVVVMMALGVVTSSVARVDPRFLLANTVMLTGLAILGMGLAGEWLAAAAPTAYVIVFSVPGLVPEQWNLLYRDASWPLSSLAASIIVLVGIAAYARRGSQRGAGFPC